MRELCNVSYVAQAEPLTEPGEFERWSVMLHAPPPGRGRGGRPQSFIDTTLDDLMPDLPPRVAA